MSWDWRVYFGSLVVCTIVVMYTRVILNDVNIAQYGPKGDFRNDPGAVVKSIVAGALFAVMITAVIGAMG
jgi:hypothetical protein